SPDHELFGRSPVGIITATDQTTRGTPALIALGWPPPLAREVWKSNRLLKSYRALVARRVGRMDDGPREPLERQDPRSRSDHRGPWRRRLAYGPPRLARVRVNCCHGAERRPRPSDCAGPHLWRIPRDV